MTPSRSSMRDHPPDGRDAHMIPAAQLLLGGQRLSAAEHAAVELGEYGFVNGLIKDALSRMGRPLPYRNFSIT